VNNTTAREIATDANLARAFTEETGIELDGTTAENVKTVQNAARERAYGNQQNALAQAAIDAQERQEAQNRWDAQQERQAQETAQRQAREQARAEREQAAREEQAVRESGYDSYIRGVLKDGVNVNEAREIARNQQMRETWERMTGKTLPTNEKSAVKMIMQTHRTNAVIPTAAQEQGTQAESAQQSETAKSAEDYLLENVPGQKNNASETETESTGINTDPAAHTPEQQRVINDYVSSTDKGIVTFVKRVRQLTNPKYRNTVRYSISEVSPRAAQEVATRTGIDASGFENIITGSAVDHIDARHGSSGRADHSMSNINDIARVRYVLDNFDGSFLLTNDDGTPSVSDVWKNSDGTPAQRVVFYKKLDGVYYAVEATPDSKARVLAIESAFIGTEKNIGSTGTVLDMEKNSPQVTSETPQRANASAVNVPESGGNVKSDALEDILSESADTQQGQSEENRTRSQFDNWKKESKKAKRITFKDGATKKFASDLSQSNGKTLSAAEVYDRLLELQKYLSYKGSKANYDKVYNEALSLAHELVDNAETVVFDEMAERNGIVDIIRRFPINASELVKSGEIEYSDLYGTPIKHRKNGTSLDDLYYQLQVSYGEHLFPDMTEGGNMIVQIKKVLDSMAERRGNPNGRNLDAAAQTLAEEIVNRLTNGSLGAISGVVEETTVAADANETQTAETAEQTTQNKYRADAEANTSEEFPPMPDNAEYTAARAEYIDIYAALNEFADRWEAETNLTAEENQERTSKYLSMFAEYDAARLRLKDAKNAAETAKAQESVNTQANAESANSGQNGALNSGTEQTAPKTGADALVETVQGTQTETGDATIPQSADADSSLYTREPLESETPQTQGTTADATIPQSAGAERKPLTHEERRAQTDEFYSKEFPKSEDNAEYNALRDELIDLDVERAELSNKWADTVAAGQNNEASEAEYKYQYELLSKKITAVKGKLYSFEDSELAGSVDVTEGDGASREAGLSRNVRTDEGREEALRKAIEADPDFYSQKTNKSTLEAATEIFNRGLDEARAEVDKALGMAQAGSKLKPEIVPLTKMVADKPQRKFTTLHRDAKNSPRSVA
jgi:hypothetical protein